MNNITIIKDCKYRLPCGWCDRKNMLCQFETPAENIFTNTLDEQLFNTPICNHEWFCSGADCEGLSYTCRKCGKNKKENYQKLPYVTPAWINPEAPSIDKVGDFPPYNHVTCTSGYINTNECPEATIEATLSTNVTTSAQTIATESKAQHIVETVTSGNLPNLGTLEYGLQDLE